MNCLLRTGSFLMRTMAEGFTAERSISPFSYDASVEARAMIGLMTLRSTGLGFNSQVSLRSIVADFWCTQAVSLNGPLLTMTPGSEDFTASVLNVSPFASTVLR